MRRLAAVLLSVVALSSASLGPAAASDFGPTVRTVAYGKDRLQTVRVGTPDVGAKVRRPTVIFLHGGGWVGGGPSIWTKEAQAWTDHGWVTVNASYRLGSPAGGNTTATGQAMLQDVTAVLALTRTLPHVDRDHVVLVGDSAGGHLAGWLAGRYRSAIAGLILWSPVASPSDLVQDAATDWTGQAGNDGTATAACPALCVKQVSLARRAADLFGWSARTTTGLSYLANEKPVPTWVAGSTDEWVRLDRNGARFCALAGSACSMHEVPGTQHGTKLRDVEPELVTSMRRFATAIAEG